MFQWGAQHSNKLNSFRAVVLSLCLIIVCTGCNLDSSGDNQPINKGYELDITFREIYDNLGGEPILGGAISSLMLRDEVEYQYVENALLKHDRSDPGQFYYKLDALGSQMGFQDPPVPPPAAPGLKYVNGHVIFPDFVAFYERYYGNAFFGKPISEVHYNPQRNRYEQYFENVGLYRREGDPPGKVGLLAYGSAACGKNCSSPEGGAGAIDVLHNQDTPFQNYLDQLTTTVTGFPLTPAYQTSDGKIEQVFENLVLVADPTNLPGVKLHSLADSLTIEGGGLEDPNGDPSYQFFPIDGQKGYNIRGDFWEFLQAHGGIELSGPPVTGVMPRANQRLRQCFVNLCLLYDENLPEGYRVRVEPLGYQYKELYARNDPKGSAGNVMINTQEKYASLRPGEVQEISINVIDGDAPLSGVQPVLEITLPNGQQQSYIFPPTGAEGEASLPLPPMVARSYTLVPYRVCLSGVGQVRVCKNDTFIILDNP
jgi:hypothetical protein